MQYWLPSLVDASEDKKPKFKLEYTTMSADGARAAFPLKELPRALRSTEAGVKKKGRKYTPYGLEDLTIGSWLRLGRKLGDERESRVRALFRSYMYQGADA